MGCTFKSHLLYGTFMPRLSRCIFEWDMRDFEPLMSAKRGEMVAAGIPHPAAIAVKKAITNDELARHSRRRTRGTEKTIELIETLLSSALIVVRHRHSRCAAPQRGGKGDLGGAEASCPLPPGSPRGGAVYHHRPHHQGWRQTAGLAVCSRVHFPGELPPASFQVHFWNVCERS